MAAKEDDIPFNDAELVNWAANFMTVLSANAASLGLVPENLAPVEAERVAFGQALLDHVQQQALAKAAVEKKKAQRRSFEAVLSPLVRWISSHPGMTSELRANLGLRVPVKGRTVARAGSEAPGLVLETRPGQVLVHFGTNLSNELLNGKPDWARGCVIFRRKGDEPSFSMIAFDIASPYLDRVTGPAVDVTYKVAYCGTRENDLGPMSPEQTVAAGG